MESAKQLGLNEALLTINKSSLHDSLDVYYQINECFGCPLEKLRKLTSRLENLTIDTKYKFELELRNSTSTVCHFSGLEFNDHGHYQIDVKKGRLSDIECSLQTLDKGVCYLCPVALLISFILLASFAENLYSKYISTKKTSLRVSKDESNTNTTVSIETDASENDEQQVNESASQNENSKETQEISNKNRIDSLDTFRGLTIALMIMVNYGGAGYMFLEHKLWDGITLGDFVFPFFIFSMGVSIAISILSLVKKGKTYYQIVKKILKRSIILLLLGLCLNSIALQDGDLNHLRLTGVLQRFSISYLTVALVYSTEIMFSSWIKTKSFSSSPWIVKLSDNILELLTGISSLVIYLYFTFYFAFSSRCPAAYTGPGGQSEDGQFFNCTGGAAAWIDRTVLGENHMYKDTTLHQIFKTNLSHDPEGLLGNTTSILLTLIGLQCGKILVHFKDHKVRLVMFMQWIGLLAIGCIAVVGVPINKKLWSLTFVTLTGACAFIVMSLLYLIVDVYKCKGSLFLQLIMSAGKNSIFLYVGHSLIHQMLPWYFSVDETSHLQLMLRLTWSTFVWLLVAHFMARKRLYIKV